MSIQFSPPFTEIPIGIHCRHWVPDIPAYYYLYIRNIQKHPTYGIGEPFPPFGFFKIPQVAPLPCMFRLQISNFDIYMYIGITSVEMQIRNEARDKVFFARDTNKANRSFGSEIVQADNEKYFSGNVTLSNKNYPGKAAFDYNLAGQREIHGAIYAANPQSRTVFIANEIYNINCLVKLERY